ncbi:MAG: lipase family protein [Candidatus Azotimanducaceae bacterium WSBS_2022_MAG_OTU7]
MTQHFHLVENLTSPPLKRAAYSDRTAWIMAVMSALAYVRFEEPTSMEELATRLARETEERKILQSLTELLAAENRDQLMQSLKDDLQAMGFELVKTYNISIPLVADTQAFLARLNVEGREPLLVLAFRGTETNKAADIKADISANPMQIGPEIGDHKVHEGFYQAFQAVETLVLKDLDKPENKPLPLYITGHGSGGALAVVATYCLASDRIAACYTYGAPRVGNREFGLGIKPPIYRVVNAADLVPRLPPSFLIEGLTLLLRWLPVIPYNQKMAGFLDKYRHYRHHGDLRYLTAATRKAPEAGDPATYPGLEVIANPAQLSRWFWCFKRWVASGGRAAINDHSVATYMEKLAHWGVKRVQNQK